MTSQELVAIEGSVASVKFSRFDLDEYKLFIATKRLPESQISFDWRADEYRLTTPARFAPLLGAPEAVALGARPPLASHLFDYQAWIVGMALEAERFAVWCDTGLGKTAIYLEWARQVIAVTGGRVLILAPLAVIPQIREMAAGWYGADLPIKPLGSRDDLIAWCDRPGSGVGICNYEKLIPGTISELRGCAGLICDEASILKTGGGTIKWNLIKSAKGIQYKLACTATPAPNDAMEYASQAGFLEKMRSEGEILWTYFSRDKSGVWSIKPHAKSAFYRFMASWSIYMRDPSRFGFADILASLPAPEIIEERLPQTDEQRQASQSMLASSGKGMFGDNLGVKERSALAQVARGFRYGKDAAGRKTVERIPSLKPLRVADIAKDEIRAGRQVLIWTTFDEEGEILVRLLGESAAVLDGSMSEAKRAETLEDFRAGRIDVLISKPQLLGVGLNFQFVRSMIFSGFDDSFERMYQATRRCYRFGQTETVRVHIPYIPELEGLMFDNVRAKEARFLDEVAIQEANYRSAFALIERKAA